MFEKRVLRRIFGPRRDEVTEERRRLHNEELNDLYSPNIVRVIKSRRMRWAGHVARMGEERGVYRVLLGKPERRNHWGYLGVDGRITLGWISRRWDVCTWSVRKVSDLWPGKRNWLTRSVGHLITLKVVPLGLHTLLPAVPPLLEACRKSLFRNGV